MPGHANRIAAHEAGRLLAAALLMPAAGAAVAADLPAAPVFTVNGRVNAGIVYRLESTDARLPFNLNGAAAGVAAINGTGANADDANLNFRRHDAVSRGATGTLDLNVQFRETRALLRIKGWRDNALRDDARSWGNAANGYAAGAPLSDAGAPPLSRFSGVVVSDAWVEHRVQAGDWRLLGRAGQQSLDWGTNVAFGGGLEVLNARDLPAGRRAGATLADARVPAPLLFVGAEWKRTFGVEAFYQTHFRPNAIDMCGSFGAASDYLADGCDKVMSGQPALSDRARVAQGVYLKRLPTPRPGGSEFGLALRWKLPDLGLRLGAYHARYTSRTAAPGLRKSSRAGPAFIAGDPDGRNIAFFTEYAEGLRIDALGFTHDSGAYGELSRRPRQPLLFGPGDALPPFMSTTVPALLREDAGAVAPGGLFHGFENYPMWQAQAGVARAPAGAAGIGWSFEVVAKHVVGLPDQALRRYGRSDVYGSGPVFGVCSVNMPVPVPALQCSQRGYVSANAAAWRARVEARLPALIDGVTASIAAAMVYDARGWSADFLINQGRRSASLALRADYRSHYLFEVAWLPVWGGDYNASADRDVLALSVGYKF